MQGEKNMATKGQTAPAVPTFEQLGQSLSTLTSGRVDPDLQQVGKFVPALQQNLAAIKELYSTDFNERFQRYELIFEQFQDYERFLRKSSSKPALAKIAGQYLGSYLENKNSIIQQYRADMIMANKVIADLEKNRVQYSDLIQDAMKGFEAYKGIPAAA